MIREAVGAVLLAAGRASRYGAPKQLIPVGGIPMVRLAALTAMQCVERTVIVTGACRAEVEACLGGLDVVLAFNSAWQRGMGDSIACGVERLLRLDPSVGACLIMLADQPLVTAGDLAALIDAHWQRPEHVIASDYGGTNHGPPCLFPCHYFEELMALQGPAGARSVLRGHPGEVHFVSNPRARMDIDTPEDRRRWLTDGATEGSPADRQ
ncbi:MAG: nucleotidyltransferase family protein [Rhodanobacteraceae bacterium]